MTSALLVAACAVGGLWSAYVGACVVLAAGGPQWVTGARWRFKGLLARRIDLEPFEDRCGIYVHWWLLVPLYVGQSIDADSRMYKHGTDIRTQCYTHCTFFDVDADRLNQVETWLHDRFPWTQWLGFNRTGGGS